MSLSVKILLGLLLGCATGLFFGELVAELKLVGELFVRLLQMTVLPYIIVSLIAGFGRMQMAQARLLAVRGSLVLVAIWGLALLLIFAAAAAFPVLETAGFFSSVSSHEPPKTDLLSLYIPSNVFYSLSNNLVPAVVFFSILVGVALMAVAMILLPTGDAIAKFVGASSTYGPEFLAWSRFAIGTTLLLPVMLASGAFRGNRTPKPWPRRAAPSRR